MAITKIGKEGITGVSNSADATFLTATSGEGVTLAGTLAVTGIHTIGQNAINTSDGGAVTKNLSQGLTKAWGNSAANGASIANSFNIASLTDQATGQQFFNLTSNFSDGNLGGGTAQTSVGNEMITAGGTTSQVRLYAFDGSAYQDQSLMFNMCGDQA